MSVAGVVEVRRRIESIARRDEKFIFVAEGSVRYETIVFLLTPPCAKRFAVIIDYGSENSINCFHGF